jgi:hypothetical protein
MKRIMRLSIIGLLVSLLSAATLGASRTLQAHGNSQPLTLQSVTTRTLGASGVTLAPPAGNPDVSADDASRVALQYFPGAQIRERVLARFQDRYTNPPLDTNGWIVSVVPHGGIYSASGGLGGNRLPGTYHLLVIDAQTGQLVLGISGGEVK